MKTLACGSSFAEDSSWTIVGPLSVNATWTITTISGSGGGINAAPVIVAAQSTDFVTTTSSSSPTTTPPSAASSATAPTSSPTTSSSSAASNGETLTLGGKIGLGFGVAAFVVLALLGFGYLWILRRKTKNAHNVSNGAASGVEGGIAQAEYTGYEGYTHPHHVSMSSQPGQQEYMAIPKTDHSVRPFELGPRSPPPPAELDNTYGRR